MIHTEQYRTDTNSEFSYVCDVRTFERPSLGKRLRPQERPRLIGPGREKWQWRRQRSAHTQTAHARRWLGNIAACSVNRWKRCRTLIANAGIPSAKAKSNRKLLEPGCSSSQGNKARLSEGEI